MRREACCKVETNLYESALGSDPPSVDASQFVINIAPPIFNCSQKLHLGFLCLL